MPSCFIVLIGLVTMRMRYFGLYAEVSLFASIPGVQESS